MAYKRYDSLLPKQTGSVGRWFSFSSRRFRSPWFVLFLFLRLPSSSEVSKRESLCNYLDNKFISCSLIDFKRRKLNRHHVKVNKANLFNNSFSSIFIQDRMLINRYQFNRERMMKFIPLPMIGIVHYVVHLLPVIVVCVDENHFSRKKIIRWSSSDICLLLLSMLYW